jgi:hypothetical protein
MNKHNEYVVNKNLKHFDDISFYRELFGRTPPIPFMHFSDVVSIFRSDDVIDELRIGLLNELHDIMFKVIYSNLL